MMDNALYNNRNVPATEEDSQTGIRAELWPCRLQNFSRTINTWRRPSKQVRDRVREEQKNSETGTEAGDKPAAPGLPDFPRETKLKRDE